MRIVLGALFVWSLGASAYAAPTCDGSCVAPTDPNDRCADYALITPPRRVIKVGDGTVGAATKAANVAHARLLMQLHGGVALDLR